MNEQVIEKRKLIRITPCTVVETKGNLKDDNRYDTMSVEMRVLVFDLYSVKGLPNSGVEVKISERLY